MSNGYIFGSTSNIDDIDDEAMEAELMSSRDKHSKCDSLMHDENFTTAATAYVREHGYVKGALNLTLSDFTSWVLERLGVEICDETARVWLYIRRDSRTVNLVRACILTVTSAKMLLSTGRSYNSIT